MKQILLTLLAGAAFTAAKAQMTLEHEYPGMYNHFVYKLDGEGEKYTLYDTLTKKITIFNTNHSLWKTINYTVPNGETLSHYNCVSTKFFNNDPKVELAVAFYRWDQSISKIVFTTQIINEDGTLIQHLDDVTGLAPKKVGGQWKVITNQYSGTKTSIYSVPGSMPDNTGLKPSAKEESLSSIYPNPVDDAAIITYNLPEGVSQAELSVYSSSGQKVKTMTVTSHFNSILIYRGDLPAGSYIYEVAGQKQHFAIR